MKHKKRFRRRCKKNFKQQMKAVERVLSAVPWPLPAGPIGNAGPTGPQGPIGVGASWRI